MLWVLDGGKNRYQFIYAEDLVDACIKSVSYNKSDIFNIGSDNVKSFREIYEFIIRKVGTGSVVVSFPKKIAIMMMKFAYLLKLSPLGPYQYKMIGENFIFDTSKIKEKLKWSPTLTNEEMLEKAYIYYHRHKEEIKSRKSASAHKKASKMGILKVLKWFS